MLLKRERFILMIMWIKFTVQLNSINNQDMRQNDLPKSMLFLYIFIDNLLLLEFKKLFQKFMNRFVLNQTGKPICNCNIGQIYNISFLKIEQKLPNLWSPISWLHCGLVYRSNWVLYAYICMKLYSFILKI